MAHPTQIRILTYMRTLSTGSLLAVAVMSAPVSQAHAAQNNGDGGTTQTGKNCINPDTGGRTIAPGTVWTSTTQNCQVTSRYKCTGKTGEWDRMAGPPVQQPGPRAPMGGRVLSR